MPGVHDGRRVVSRCEEWRPIPGFEVRYEVSNRGRVRSIARVVICRNGTPKPFKAQVKKSHKCKGYPHVVLYDDAGKRLNRYVHVLVCAAFHGPKPAEDYQVRHLNGDQTDNRAENLAWGTQSDNMIDRVIHGRDQFASRTACSQGHEYTETNTHWFISSTGRPARSCRACIRERGAKRRRRRGVPVREFKTHCPRGHEYSSENTYVYNGCRTCRTCSREGARRRWEQQKPGPRPLATHCIHGHPFDETNTYFRPSGGRSCRICMQAGDRRYKARQKAKRSEVKV